jgi:predicted ATP-grasp superfamily ATP-dependent carboligase
LSARRVPVVLLGGLNVVRALGLARIPAIIASPERNTPAMASRYCAASILLPPIAQREAYAEALARAGRRLAEEHGTRLPLFYDNDDRLSIVQDYRALLEPHYRLLLNDPELDAALLDKALFQALGESRGLPVPRRIAWEALEGFPGAVLAKPKVKTAWDHSSIHRQLFGGAGKARIFASGAEAHANETVRALAAQLQFQELVPGGDDALWSFHGFADERGNVLASFVGRKLRTYPELTGDSAYLRLVRDENVAALGREIAARLPLAGIFKMDFKRHPRTGRFHLLEINTRFNLWHYVGAMNGVNLPGVAYEYLFHGRKILVPGKAKTRYRWLSLRFDWRAYKELSLYGRIGFVQWLASLLEAPKVYEYFAWTDPAPFLRIWGGRFHNRWRRLWHSTAS